MKVISGAQIGADIAGLRAAKRCDIETGGWVPAEGRIKGGFLPEDALIYYGLQPTNSPGYPMRTLNNVLDSQGTIRLAYNFESPGERLTLKYAHAAHRPVLDVLLQKVRDEWMPCLTEEAAVKWLTHPRRNIETINIAGNADREIEKCVEEFLIEVFEGWKAVTL